MKTFLSVLVLSGCALQVGAEPAAPFPLWPNGAPGALGTADKDIPTLTAYLPEAEKTAGAAVVICPGGGYAGLANHEGDHYARFLNEQGIAGFVLKYRLGSGGYRHPAMLQDAARAVRTVRARAAEWKVDSKRVAIMGSSAGGHLASTLLTHFDAGQPEAEDPIERQSSRPDAGILCYAVITLGHYTHQGSKNNLLGKEPAQELVRNLSNELQVTKDTPPCFLWHTWEDKAVPIENSLQFAQALQNNGVPFDLHVYQKGNHGLGLGSGQWDPAKRHPWTADLVYWLKAQGFCEKQSVTHLDTALPVRGLCIQAPNPSQVDTFTRFIAEELAPRLVNTLILRVDFNYQYTSRPELGSPSGLSPADVKKLAAVCRTNKIRLIPQINLLGHQSWQRSTGKLLQVYPEFDETPWVKTPEKYSWPNPDGLYCRSYCPLHPQVHEVVMPLVDEICDVFESDAFHAGMDEVFYIGEAKCPRCGGKDKAELFANEIRLIRDHLNARQRQLWIWGDRLLDGKTTGLGEWEASMNDTARAIDLIPKDVFICDWHYERAHLSPVHFAMKGFHVASCPWRNPQSAVQQLHDMLRFREQATAAMKPRFQGVIQTVWSDVNSFLRDFEGHRKSDDYKKGEKTAARCFIQLFDQIRTLAR